MHIKDVFHCLQCVNVARYKSAVLAIVDMSVCPSVCPSVRLSGAAGVVSKRSKLRGLNQNSVETGNFSFGLVNS